MLFKKPDVLDFLTLAYISSKKMEYIFYFYGYESSNGLAIIEIANYYPAFYSPLSDKK